MICDGHDKGGISSVDKIIHIIYSPHRILHVFHDSFHLVHLSLQKWYPASDSTLRLVSFSVILSTFISWILASFSTMVLTLSIDFSS